MRCAEFKSPRRLARVAGLGAVALFLVGMVTAGAAEPATDVTDLSWVDQRIADWELTDEERRFDEIGWAGGLDEAARLARQWQRPLFVFTYSGSATEANAIALRRC
ncbi:MAG TPA: hypothetical protein VJ783_08420 [Pirellulales bacterium]|nr:hypothetical protein [Pirellulales bacterium]